MWIRTRTALAVSLLASPAIADDVCPQVADAWTLARCAATHSERIRRARYDLDAARGRRTAAGQLLPANPTLDLGMASRRSDSGASDIDRGVDVSQAFDVAGQRGLRIAVSDAEIAAAKATLDAALRQLDVDVLVASVGVRRAELELGFARDQRALAERLVEISSARVRNGVAAGLDVELAEATRVQGRRNEVAAARALNDAAARLALVVGADVTLATDKPIQVTEPPRDVDLLVRQGIGRRQLVRTAEAEGETGRRRVTLLRRERIPSVTIGAFYRREEFSNVAGGRLAIPLPIVRRNRGEIAEQEAIVGQADTAAAQARLQVALEVRTAFAAWQQARALVEEMPADLGPRLDANAQALREAYERGALPLASALASLREVWNARRTVAEANAEATLATLELIGASAGDLAPAHEGQP